MNTVCNYLSALPILYNTLNFAQLYELGHMKIVIINITYRIPICLFAAVWSKVLEPIAKLRRDADMLKLFPMFLTGEELYGLTEPAIQRVIESVSKFPKPTHQEPQII